MQTISIALAAEIIYVTGTVNGVSVTFTLSGSVWVATVDIAEDGEYEISITGLDAVGNVTEYTITQYYGFHTVTDRTQADVINQTAKGFYTHEDLNRVERSVEWLADQFNLYGYAAAVEIKTDWTLEDIPIKSQMQRYLDNIQDLIDAYYTLTTTPELPESMDFLTWAKANDIEKILLDMKTLLGNMLAAFRYCGEIFAGEE